MAKNTNVKKVNSGNKPFVILLVILIAIICVMGFFGYKFIIKANAQVPAQSSSTAKSESKQLPEDLKTYAFKDEFLTNLSDGHFIKAKITIAYTGKAEKEVEEMKDIMRDEINSFLLKSKKENFNGETLGKTKDLLTKNVSKYLTTGEVYKVYFADIVVQ